MRLLAIDLETSGLEPKTDYITEIGAALYDTDRKHLLETVDYLIEPPKNAGPLSSKIEALTGITTADLEEFGHRLDDVIVSLGAMCQERRVKFLVGHNARAFDWRFLVQAVARMGDTAPAEARFLIGIPWIDTREDVEYPADSTSFRLGHLAADHGFLNPFPHRALFDAVTCLRLLGTYDLDRVIYRAESPTVTVIAHNLPFERRHEAKDARFQWDPGARVWVRKLKDFEVDDLRRSLPFEIRVQKAA